MSKSGTFETCRQTLRMSAVRHAAHFICQPVESVSGFAVSRVIIFHIESTTPDC
jgi:hypothetical protein